MTVYITKEKLGKFSEIIANKYGAQKEIVVNISAFLIQKIGELYDNQVSLDK